MHLSANETSANFYAFDVFWKLIIYSSTDGPSRHILHGKYYVTSSFSDSLLRAPVMAVAVLSVIPSAQTVFLRYGVISLYGLSSWVGAGVKEVYFLVHQFVFIFWIVTFHVQRQVVGAREAAVTWLTLKRLGSRVLPDVTCQLVGARELPRTVLVRALVGLFSCRNKQAVTLQRS